MQPWPSAVAAQKFAGDRRGQRYALHHRGIGLPTGMHSAIHVRGEFEPLVLRHRQYWSAPNLNLGDYSERGTAEQPANPAQYQAGAAVLSTPVQGAIRSV